MKVRSKNADLQNMNKDLCLIFKNFCKIFEYSVVECRRKQFSSFLPFASSTRLINTAIKSGSLLLKGKLYDN